MQGTRTTWRPERLAGRGGLGVVWAARDPHSGLRVAMKVMPGLSGDQAPAFLTEVRAVAALHHPNVVRVFDLGVVDEAQAEAGEGALFSPHGALPVGAPFLVMEWVGGGPLRAVERWAELRDLLAQVLRALAHAHARGVLHRDLKPANLLVGGPGDLRPGPKLVDFGLARLPGSAVGSASGTPAYMAPEQITGGQEGPWTDLYALGVMAWQLVTGQVPAAGDSTQTTLEARVLGALPVFEPVIDVPAGLEAWLTRLLARWPEQRFPFAADALRGLLVLGEPVSTHRRGRTVVPAAPTLPLDSGLLGAFLAPAELGEAPPEPAPLPEVVVPPAWEELEVEAVGQVGITGLRLFGLRELPLVGRRAERQALWSRLRAVATEGRPQAVVLRGPAGLGKSRLARWLVEQVHALGVALPVSATTGRPPASDRLLVDLLEAAFHLPIEEKPRRAALARLPEGIEVALDPDARLSRRLTAAIDLLKSAAGSRPLVVWLDDAQWSATALALALAILREPEAGATLVVLTIQEEALADRPVERAALERLVARADVALVPVGPLPDADLDSLLDGLVQLEPVTLRTVREHAVGNPLLAIRLVDGWILRGLLVETPRGLGLSSAPEPGQLAPEAVVRDELEALLAGRPAAEAEALERAAVLGDSFTSSEWAAANAAGRLPVPTGLVESLLDRGILRRLPTGFVFAQGLFRQALRHRAAQAGREVTHNLAVARVLGQDDPARVGEHWLAGGELLRGAAALLDAARSRRNVHAISAVGVALRRARGALEAAAVPDRDPLWGECLRLEMWLAATAVSPAVGAVAAGRARAWAARNGRSEEELEARCREILCRAQAGEPVDAVSGLRAAWEEALRDEDGRMVLIVGDFFAAELRNHGLLAEATSVATRLLELGERTNDRFRRGTALRHLGVFARMQGRTTDALAAFSAARDLLDPHTWEHAETVNNLGDLLRETGRPTEAAICYEHAAARFRAMGSFDTCVPLINHALLHIGEGRMEEADALLQRCVASLVQSEQRRMEAIARLIRLAPLARRGDRAGFEAELALGRPPLADTGYVDPDVAFALERAGIEARARGWDDLAASVEAWAQAQRVGLSG